MTTREPRIPGPDHPITIEKAGLHVLARVGTHLIADTTRALTLREAGYPPVQYIPLDDVDQTLLAPSETQTYCPYKGDASYYTITLPEGGLIDAVWSYREPYESVSPIANHVAFYTDRWRLRPSRRDQKHRHQAQTQVIGGQLAPVVDVIAVGTLAPPVWLLRAENLRSGCPNYRFLRSERREP